MAFKLDLAHKHPDFIEAQFIRQVQCKILILFELQERWDASISLHVHLRI